MNLKLLWKDILPSSGDVLVSRYSLLTGMNAKRIVEGRLIVKLPVI